jgi:hypothetical protein
MKIAARLLAVVLLFVLPGFGQDKQLPTIMEHTVGEAPDALQ